MDFLLKINWVDVLIAIVILRVSYIAFQDGLSHQIFPFVGAIVVVAAGLHYYEKIALFLSQNIVALPIELLEFLSFVVIIVIVGLVFKLLKFLLDKIVKITWNPMIEKFGGIIIGIAKAVIICSLILIILSLVPLSYLQWSIRDKSLTGMYFLKIGPMIHEKIAGVFPAVNIGKGSFGNGDGAMVDKLAKDKSIGPNAKRFGR